MEIKIVRYLLMLEHYKSWVSVKKRLEEFLCNSLSGRITYFLTYYHKVRNSYGRASIRVDGKDLVCFSWIEMYHQERDISEAHKKDPTLNYDNIEERLKPQWNAACTYCESDFIDAVQKFFHLSIECAHSSDNYIIKILAILDRRTGKRTLKRILDLGEYSNYPEWVQPFYKLRFEAEKI